MINLCDIIYLNFVLLNTLTKITFQSHQSNEIDFVANLSYDGNAYLTLVLAEDFPTSITLSLSFFSRLICEHFHILSNASILIVFNVFFNLLIKLINFYLN